MHHGLALLHQYRLRSEGLVDGSHRLGGARNEGGASVSNSLAPFLAQVVQARHLDAFHGKLPVAGDRDGSPKAKEQGVAGEGEVRVKGVVWVKVKGVVGEGEVKAKVRE